ncbi:hypothetical protein [Aliikangiella maris]|uniref:Uncharacterized protein n=2 Tax=Aliikangiella maris TaxID=3162458 RepID=A0ABV3MNY9_9GAMM
MDAFLINITSFPTAIYTTALIAVIGFWFLVMFGLFDIDALEIDIDLEVDVSQVGGVAGLLTTLGLTGVPVTFVLTMLVLNAWFICYFATLYIPELTGILGLIEIIVKVIIGILSFLLSLPVTAILIRPLRRMFRRVYQNATTSLIGKHCRIRSSRVDDKFGEAECSINGASLIIKVRSDSHTTFSQGETAVIVEHEPLKNTYQIVSQKEFNSSF